MSLRLSYLHDDLNHYVSTEDADAEPEMGAAVGAAGTLAAKIDAMVAWLARNPRKLEHVALTKVDEATARRVVESLSPPSLSLSIAGLRGGWLSSRAATLERLELRDISSFEVATLCELPKLSCLAFWARGVDLSFLAKIPGLTELELEGADDLVVPDLPRLASLKLDKSTVATGGLAALTGLRSLAVVDVKLGEAGALPSLETLACEEHREPLSPRFIRDLTALRSITANLLQLPPGAADVTLEVFAPCGELEALDLSMQSVSGFETLAKLAKLTSLKLFANAPGTVDIAALSGLRTLWITGQLKATNLGAATKLGELLLATAGDLDELARCDDLASLTVHKAKGLSLVPLAGLRKLSTLALGYDIKPTAKMMEPLATNHGLTVSSKLGEHTAAELYGQLSGSIKVPKQADFAQPAFVFKGKKAGTAEPLVTGSHSFGPPYLAPGETWPACGHCGTSMPCLLQVDLAPMKGWNGLLQVFYCTAVEPKHCEVDCKTWARAGSSMLLRIIEPKSSSAPLAPKDLPKHVTKLLTVDTKAVLDVPNVDDAEALGVKDAPKEPKKGDKLGGWPHWIQGAEWPKCPDCANRMTLLAQLDSNKAVEHRWGDLGYAYVFACAEHRSRLGFCWASG